MRLWEKILLTLVFLVLGCCILAPFLVLPISLGGLLLIAAALLAILELSVFFGGPKMSDHFKVVCRACGTIQNQCRCPSKDKTIQYVICPGCAQKAAQGLLDLDKLPQK